MSQPTAEEIAEVTAAKAQTGYHLPEQYCLGCQDGPDDFADTDCRYCWGTGILKHAPWANSAWTQVYLNLWVGGHEWTSLGLVNRWVTPKMLAQAKFDLVVSLYRASGTDPSRPVSVPQPPTEHVEHLFEDDPFALRDPGSVQRIQEIATEVAQAVEAGRKVLVRCHAGMNRSALVTALALVQMGVQPQEAIDLIRQKRTRFALFNTSFVDLILAQQPQTQEAPSE